MKRKKSANTQRTPKSEYELLRQDRKAVAAWQFDHIGEGLRQADAGEFATEFEMKATLSPRRK